ncbi:MAG: replication protein P [Halioglobus sp.]
MRDTRELVSQAGREIEASSKTSATPPGRTKKQTSQAKQDAAQAREGHIEAINQVFALFRLNYHNQYYAAYPDGEQLNQIKKLWLEALADYPVEQILKGAKHAIENSEYLPTLKRMLESAAEGLSELGLPSARNAYLEACQMPSPKSAQPWSHPAVYLAGKDTDWFFLANNAERTTWPLFQANYQRYCAQVLRGEQLEIPEPAAIEQEASEPLSREEQLGELAKLKSEMGL